MPSGNPVDRLAISVTATAVCGSWGSKSWRAARARSTNRVTASDVTPPAVASGDTVATDSLGTPRVSRRRVFDIGE
jgi:hypothetical protein